MCSAIAAAVRDRFMTERDARELLELVRAAPIPDDTAPDLTCDDAGSEAPS